MIPRLKPKLGISELLAAFRLPGHDDVEQFEKAFAVLMDQKFALAFPYGRTALILLLKALALKGQEIICPAYTCVVVPHAIVFSGNTPVFIDCTPGSFNMDLEKADQIISNKTGALIATSIFGYPVDLDKLDKIKAKHPHVQIIQDCAHSFAAEWKGRPVQKEGIAAFYGLNISKLLTSIFGGMITTDDEALFDKLKQVRENLLKQASLKKSIRRLIYFLAVYPAFSKRCYGIINHLERTGLLNRFVKYYDEFRIDMPDDYLEAMANVEARVGLANIDRYHDIIKSRSDAANHYYNNLQNHSDFQLSPQVNGATYSHFAIAVKDRKRWLQRGIESKVQLGWLIDYCVPTMRPYGNQSKEKFPIASEYAETIINLPIWGGEKLACKVLTKTLKK